MSQFIRFGGRQCFCKNEQDRIINMVICFCTLKPDAVCVIIASVKTQAGKLKYGRTNFVDA